MTHHIIRDLEELKALHPDTILIDNNGGTWQQWQQHCKENQK